MDLTNSLQIQSHQPFETAKARLARLEQTPLTRPIADDAEYQQLASVIVEVKNFRKEWDGYTKPIRAKTKEAHSEACKMFSDIDNALDVLLRRATPFLLDYDNRQEIARRAEEARINANIAAEEAKRREDEAARLAELHPTPEGAAPAEEIETVFVPPPLVVSLPKFAGAAGLTRRTTYRAEVKDLKALAKAVGAGKVPLSYILPNLTMLNAQARAMKKDLQIPGVDVVEEVEIAAQRAAR